MGQAELLIAGLLVAVAGLSALARSLSVPYPIVLVVGGASAILATVAAGIYMGIRGPQILPARTRLQGYFVWDILDFIITAILFVLIGLQLRAVVDGLSGQSASALGGYALAVTVAVVGTRLVWLFTVP